MTKPAMTVEEKAAAKLAKKAEKEAAKAAAQAEGSVADEGKPLELPASEDVEVQPNEDAPRTVEEKSCLLEMKGWKAWQSGDAFHVTDKEGRIVGHFPSATAAIRYVENVSRHVR